MTEYLCVLNTRKGEDTFGKEDYIIKLTAFDRNCLLQSLDNLRSVIRTKAFYQSYPFIQELSNNAE